MLSICVNEPEFHTILAALRYYQAQGQTDPDLRSQAIDDVATNGGQVSALDAQGIDALCERINTSYQQDDENHDRLRL